MANSALRSRNFVLLVLGQVTSLLGNLSLRFALSMYILEATGSATLFSGLLALSMAPTILLSPFGGMLADRADRRKVMVALDALSGLLVLLAGLALPLGNGIPAIAVLLFALSILAAFESPTVQACVPQMLAGEALLRGNAIVSQVQAVASLVTPFLGGLFYAAFGLRPVFAAAVLCFFLTALLECFLRLAPPEAAEGPRGLRAIVREDLQASLRFLVREEPDILRLLLLAALASLFVTGTAVVGLPYLVRTVLGLSAELYGLAESALGVAAVLGGALVAALAKRLRARHLAWVLTGVGLCLAPCGLVFLVPASALARYAVLVLLFCACQIGGSVFSTYAVTAIQRRTPAALMGKVMACVSTLAMCAQPLGQIAYGALFDAFSACVALVFLPSALLVVCIGLASGRFFRRLDRANF